MSKTLAYKEDTMERVIVLERIINKKMTQQEGGTRLGLSERHIRRLLKKYRTLGPKGLEPVPRSRSNRAFSKELRDKAMNFVKKLYSDFGPTLASEKLLEEHKIKVSRETVRQWMMEENLWQGKKRRKARIHQSRERRSRFGELVQLDGSHHDWFEGRRDSCCLYVLIDDATGKVVSARFEETETTLGYMKCVEKHVKKYGYPVCYYIKDREKMNRLAWEWKKKS